MVYILKYWRGIQKTPNSTISLEMGLEFEWSLLELHENHFLLYVLNQIQFAATTSTFPVRTLRSPTNQTIVLSSVWTAQLARDLVPHQTAKTQQWLAHGDSYESHHQNVDLISNHKKCFSPTKFNFLAKATRLWKKEVNTSSFYLFFGLTNSFARINSIIHMYYMSVTFEVSLTVVRVRCIM